MQVTAPPTPASLINRPRKIAAVAGKLYGRRTPQSKSGFVYSFGRYVNEKEPLINITGAPAARACAVHRMARFTLFLTTDDTDGTDE